MRHTVWALLTLCVFLLHSCDKPATPSPAGDATATSNDPGNATGSGATDSVVKAASDGAAKVGELAADATEKAKEVAGDAADAVKKGVEITRDKIEAFAAAEISVDDLTSQLRKLSLDDVKKVGAGLLGALEAQDGVIGEINDKLGSLTTQDILKGVGPQLQKANEAARDLYSDLRSKVGAVGGEMKRRGEDASAYEI